jgi:Bacterial membrane protein YfhO
MAQSPDTPLTDPHEPRHAWAVALLTCVVGTMLLAYPALSGQFLVNIYSDQYIAGYSFREFGAQVLRATGGFALWNPYLFGGMPYVGAMHGDIFYPTAFARLVLPTDIAMTWGFILHFILAGFATYVFLRALGVTFFGALIGGIAYMLSGWLGSYVTPGHDGKLFVGAMLPLAMLCLVRGVRDGRRWAWGGLALIVGLGLLSPHPQLMQYMLVGCGIFALYLAFGLGDIGPARTLAIRRLGFALAAVVLGFAISAIQYLPVMEYTPFSPRAGGKDYVWGTSYSFPMVELLNTLIPQFTGVLEKYWGPNGIHFHSEYIGAAVWLLAFGAFRSGVRTRHVLFFTGFAVFFTLWALGGETPFYQLIYALVPGSKFFRAPSTVFYMATFAMAMLAAYGAEGLIAKAPSRRFIIAAVAVIGVTLLLGVSGALSSFAESLAGPDRTARAADNAGDLLVGTIRAMAFASLAFGIVVLRGRKKLSATAAGWALVTVVTLDMVSLLRNYWRFSPPAKQLFATDATIDFLKKATASNPGRVLDASLGGGAVSHDAMLGYDGLMAQGIRQALGYHGNELGRYQALNGANEGMRNATNPNFWQIANVRFLLTDIAETPFQGATLVAGPARNASGSMVYLYELPGDNRAAWVAPAIIKAADSVTLTTVLDPRFPVHSVAIFNDSADVTAVSLQAPPAPIDLPLTISRYDAGAISLSLTAPAPAGSALIVSENFYPGWTATVDGKPVTASRAMYSLIGVPLPTGARAIELRFTSASYERGKMITLAALGIAFLWLIGGAVTERRSTA